MNALTRGEVRELCKIIIAELEKQSEKDPWECAVEKMDKKSPGHKKMLIAGEFDLEKVGLALWHHMKNKQRWANR